MEEKSKSTFEKILYNQVSLVIAAVSLAFGVYFTFSNPQKDADKITADVKAEFVSHERLQEQRNATLDKIMDNIKNGDLVDLREKQQMTDASINALTVQIAELKTVISERIPAKK